MSRKGEKDERSTVHCIVSYLFALSGVEEGDKFEWQTLHGYNSIYGSIKNPESNAKTESEMLILVHWLLVCAGIDTRDTEEIRKECLYWHLVKKSSGLRSQSAGAGGRPR